jgi:hypothetical protein
MAQKAARNAAAGSRARAGVTRFSDGSRPRPKRRRGPGGRGESAAPRSRIESDFAGLAPEALELDVPPPPGAWQPSGRRRGSTRSPRRHWALA